MPAVNNSKVGLDFNEENDVLIIKLSGSLDIFNLEAIKEKVEEKIKGKSQVIIALDKVDYIDSSGIGFIVGTLKRLKKQDENAKLVIYGLNEYLQGLFRLINFSRLVPIADTKEEAIKILNS